MCCGGLARLEFSCNAIGKALGMAKRGKGFSLPPDVQQILEELGCDHWEANQFKDVADEGPERQGVRYMWLLLAMHVAEDENIMVEVA
jgi:hypothetical protein